MAINQFNARYKPGQELPVIAKTAIRGGRFARISDTKDADGNYQCGECGLGQHADGVAQYDSDVTNGNRIALVRPPAVARVVPGAALSAGDIVQSDSQGRAIPYVGGTAAGAAALDTGVVGSNNAITWTARNGGDGGNDLTVTIVDPGGTTAALSVDVANNGLDITVSLARAASAITSTAQNVIDAVQANGEADELVSVANKGASTGAGVMAAVSKTNLAGGVDNAETGAIALGKCWADAASDARFAEIALF